MISRIEYYLFNFLLRSNFLFVILNIKNDKYRLNIWGKKKLPENFMDQIYAFMISIFNFLKNVYYLIPRVNKLNGKFTLDAYTSHKKHKSFIGR